MATMASLTALTISRRTTLQMALASAIAGKLVGTPGSAGAQEASAGTWNWGGNAGHTGEFAGPGLDLESALGELWRIPGKEFGDDPYYGGTRIAGYLNGVMYVMNGESLSARRLKDGKELWKRSPAEIAATPSSKAITPAYVGDNAFEGPVAIDNDILLMSMSNDHLWALDTKTGDFRWDIAWAAYSSRFPIVVDHVAYCNLGGDVVAVELTTPPVIRWRGDVNGDVLGVVDGLVYVGVGDEVRALTVEDGLEYWRLSLGDLGYIGATYGVTQDGVFLASSVYDTGQRYLIKIGRDGQIAWKISGDGNSYAYGWVLGDTVTTMTSPQDGYGSLWINSRFAQNGNLGWEIEVDAARWSEALGGPPVLCAGKAYALIGDGRQGRSLLVVVDPGAGEVRGAWDSPLIPLFVADGVMIAQDDDTDDIVAIGTVPAVLRAGGRATVTKDATLRGAPRDAAIERAQVTAGTLVDITGDSETTDGMEWVPVTEQATGKSGWLPVDVLAGEDGSIRFSPIELYEFGQFESSPRFNSGTRAEITEQVELRGAPSETSAKKSTLEAGTLVTVTSPPTKTDDVEWCPVKVDATGESGWVPASVLKLAPAA